MSLADLSPLEPKSAKEDFDQIPPTPRRVSIAEAYLFLQHSTLMYDTAPATDMPAPLESNYIR